MKGNKLICLGLLLLALLAGGRQVLYAGAELMDELEGALVSDLPAAATESAEGC